MGPKILGDSFRRKKILFHVSIHYICIITPLLRKNVSILWDLFYHDVRHAVCYCLIAYKRDMGGAMEIGQSITQGIC